jgi:threonylcarbamoyladenosine tRNA methylthiotransferase CDKAL1
MKCYIFAIMSTTFHIQTAGCSANAADSEQMAGLLKQAKFDSVDTIEDADVVIFNTCTAKNPSETAFFKNLKEFKQNHPHKMVVISGCIPQADSEKLRGYTLVGTKQIHNIVQAVEESLNDNVLQILNNDEMPPLNLPRVRKNPLIEILPINRGCLGACTFCKTKQARGNLVSYPINEILREAKVALKDGVKEIWLTSQDTFCYGFDIGTDLPELLRQLVELPGDFKIRIGMGNPDHMPRIGEELLKIYPHPKIFKFLHLPLQAGHNNTLKEMRRRYTVQQFIKIIDQFRERIPTINIMTDIIVGFPTETDEHFWGTLQAVRRVSPDSINISRFWSRPGTPAAEMKELPGEIVKKRSRVLTDILENISTLQNEKWLGWQGHIVISEKGKEGQWIGRNDSYKQIIVTGKYDFGDVVKVKIMQAEIFALMAMVLQ